MAKFSRPPVFCLQKLESQKSDTPLILQEILDQVDQVIGGIAVFIMLAVMIIIPIGEEI